MSKRSIPALTLRVCAVLMVGLGLSLLFVQGSVGPQVAVAVTCLAGAGIAWDLARSIKG